ncbi:MAG: CYTH domain-containing protein [Bacteroidales bacterium]|nr:CYTH domain-containing protein [Bacteroidales bacterium]
MGVEIERKFLVKDNSYRQLANGKREIAQWYLSRDPDRTVRVRQADGRAWLTVKSRNHGASRGEWEWSVPYDEAEDLKPLAMGNVIEKTRWIVPIGGFIWEVDEFHGCHQGLVVAEIELPSTDTRFTLPSFISKEVTGDPRYYNSNL